MKQAIISDQAVINGDRFAPELALFHPTGEKFSPAPMVEVTTASAIGTVGKTTVSSEPPAGTLVAVTFTNGNSANSMTLSFNGAGARSVKLGGTASTGAKNAIAAGGVGFYLFDGTSLHQLGAYT